jgi:hypothetical protein
LIRTLTALAAVAAMVLATGALAFALGDYSGEIKGDPSSGLTWDVKNTQGGRKVRSIILTGVNFTCEKGSPGETAGVVLDEKFRVGEDGNWGGNSNAVISGFDPPARITGRLKPGGKASGTFRMKGELDPKGQPGVDCKTGLQEWRAEKVERR